jgi:hypothetical protein
MAVVLALLTGCATANHQERASLLAEPIDCDSAPEDIAALERAMPSRAERARSVVQSVAPVGVLSGVATGTYKDRVAVLSGRTEEELTARIKAIEATCGTGPSMPERDTQE